MKASDLIKHLSQLIAKHGDTVVECLDYDGMQDEVTRVTYDDREGRENKTRIFIS